MLISGGIILGSVEQVGISACAGTTYRDLFSVSLATRGPLVKDLTAYYTSRAVFSILDS
jgi:hypothetical protein